MAYQSKDSTVDGLIELLSENGFDVMASVIQRLLNEAMKIERCKHYGDVIKW